ncbi:MAG TPA: molybdopterin-dependent oxidoreductase [Chloroflexia bacterium]|nr:molybdopterin-dependent oxidoreductase [Chloroflexia bacterium]
MERVARGRYRITWGIGAGAGAALAMMAVMGLMRVGLQFPTVPELILNSVVNTLGGEAFSAALDNLYYAGRPLLFTIMLEGTLLLGVLLGLVYAWVARPQHATGQRNVLFRTPAGGVLYGLVIGLVLNTVFLAIINQEMFATRPFGIYSDSPVPLWAGLMLLALVYGVTLHSLLPKAAVTTPDGVNLSATVRAERQMDRRHFLRVVGGTALAALGGVGVFAAGLYMNQGNSFTSPVDRAQLDEGVEAALDTEAATPTPAKVSQARPTNTPKPPPTETAQPTQEPTAQPTSEPTAEPTAQAQEPPTPEVVAEAPSPTPEPPAPTSTPEPVIAQPTDTAQPVAQAIPDIKVKEITPTESFYHVSKNFFDPSPSADGWKLEIKGLVSNPYSITYKELVAMPAIEVVTGMMCISNPVGGGLIGSARWKGVRLADLIQKAGPQKGAVDIVMRAVDDYSDSITLKKALDPNVMLVWDMNGETLKATHGFPARLLVPGIYGMKHVKWLTSVELVNSDYKGFWQQPDQGWSDPAPVHTMSRIDYPVEGVQSLKQHALSGIAFAGDRSISKVEVSTDGGKTWVEAYLKPPLSGTSWAVWGYNWTPTAPGKYKVVVRATDGAGKLQAGKWTDPYPNGATGYHTVTYNVRG